MSFQNLLKELIRHEIISESEKTKFRSETDKPRLSLELLDWTKLKKLIAYYRVCFPTLSEVFEFPCY